MNTIKELRKFIKIAQTATIKYNSMPLSAKLSRLSRVRFNLESALHVVKLLEEHEFEN